MAFLKYARLLPALLVLALVAAGCSGSQQAAQQQRGQQQQQASSGGLKPFSEVVPDEAERDSGLFITHRTEDKLFYEIPDSSLGEEMLMVTRIAQTAEDIGYGGEKAGTREVRWERRGDRVLLRVISYQNRAEEGQPISQAVQNSSFEPIIASFDVESAGEGGSGVVIDVTELYEGDIPELGLQQERREAYGVRRLDSDRTFIESVKSFPKNVEVRNVLTYQAQNPPSQSSTGTISLEMAHSMVELPKNKMEARFCDERVGYFGVEFVDYGADADEAEERCYIERYRLVPSDMEAYQRGELVEPKEQIVYYVDRATPERYRQAIINGIEDWNKAFRAAGFENAIVGKMAPTEEEDPDFSPEDVRYSVVRYFASETQNAYGPNVNDPRTGEILESDIGWYHNVSKLLRNWYFVQTAGVNPAAQTTEFKDEVQRKLVRFVAAHEVGHTLGLPHNWGSSAAYTIEQLRDPAFTSTHGTAPSIMDYARFNYVAQPGDGIENFTPKIGEYDEWSIEWGYSYLPGSAQANEATLDEWIREHADDPRYFYGAQGPQIDPRSQREDLSNDAVRASELGLENLKRIMRNLTDYTYESGENYDTLDELYSAIVGQWSLYTGHVARSIGGVYETNKTYNQEGAVYEVVPREKQVRAMQFLQERVFTRPDWLLNRDVLRRIEGTGSLNRVSALQSGPSGALSLLLDPQRLARMIEAEAMAEDGGDLANEPYAPTAMLEDLRTGIWSELGSGQPVNTFRRNLQRAYLGQLDQLMNEEPDAPPEQYWDYLGYTPINVSESDIRPLMRGELTALRSDIEQALPRVSERTTRLHLEDALARIDDILTPNDEMRASAQ